MIIYNPAIQELQKELNSSLKNEDIRVALKEPVNRLLQIELEGNLNDKTTIRICEFFEKLVAFDYENKELKVLFDTSKVIEIGENQAIASRYNEENSR